MRLPDKAGIMFDQFKDKLQIPEDKWADYTSCFQRLAVPAKTMLLREGDVAKKLFLIEQGCVRAWFNDDGRDITFQFFFERNTVASIESFRKERPSLVSLETIEPAVLWWINKQDADRIIREAGEDVVLREKLIDMVFERTFDYMAHFLSFIKETPADRYLALLRDKPQIVRRVPQHYIASYLGITSVHLSRIKSKLAKEGRTSRI